MKYQRFITLSLSLAACTAQFVVAQDHRDVPVPRESRPEDGDEAPRNIRAFIRNHRERLERQSAVLNEVEGMIERGEAWPRVREKLRGLKEARVPEDQPRQFDEPARERPGDPMEGEGRAARQGDAPPDRAPLLTRAQQMELLEEVAPEFSRRLRKIEERDPVAADRMLGNARRRLIGLWEQRRRSPEDWPQRKEMFGLEMQATAAAREAAQGPEDERDRAAEQLQDILSKQFDLRAGFIERDMARAEQRAIHLREQMERHQGERDQLIERRAAEMIERAAKRPPPRNEHGEPHRHDEQGAPRPGAF